MASKRKNQAEDFTMQSPNDQTDMDSTDELLDEDERDHVIQAIDELADRGLEIEKLKEELEQTTDQLKRQAARFSYGSFGTLQLDA